SQQGERRAAAGVGPAAGSEKSEGRVHLAGRQEEDEHDAKAATADRPLLEVHLAASPGQKADRRANGDDGGDRRQANGSSAHGRRPAFRAVSTRYAPHMHRLLNTIQAMSQNRLNGRPRIIGSIRSQSGTEKHIAANGISASASAPGAGRLM